MAWEFEAKDTGHFGAVQTVTTPIRSVDTLYPAIGDLVGNVMLIPFADLVLGWWLSRKRVIMHTEIETVPA
jgi:hypothetical protein